MPPTVEVNNAIRQHPLSLWDDHGRLFESNGELLRGIRAEHAAFYDGLLNSRNIEKLFSLGLVRTEITHTRLDDYPLVLRHERVQFLTHWREWTSLMLKDAAQMACDLSIELFKNGYSADDVHIWNVLFNSGDPIFVDFTAIVPQQEFLARRGRWIRYWHYDWILPLTFISMGYPGLARDMNSFQFVTHPIDRMLRRPPLCWFPLWYYRLMRRAARQPLVFLERLRSGLQRVSLPSYSPADSQRLSTQIQAFDPESRRNQILRSLLADLSPPTVIDVGCGDGLYSLLAERMGSRVVAFDKDEHRMNALYRYVKAEHLRVTPLLMEFTTPTASGGRITEFPSATTRLACNTSLMIDSLHREVFGWKWPIPFERVAQLLAAFTNKYSVVEFLAREHEWVAKRLGPSSEFYSMGNFIRAMETHFDLVAILEVNPTSNILLFRKAA